ALSGAQCQRLCRAVRGFDQARVLGSNGAAGRAPLSTGIANNRPSSSRTTLLNVPEALRLKTDHLLPSAVNLRNQILGPTWTVRRAPIPQCQERQRQVQGQRIEQHPQIAALPDAVVTLAAKPDGQLNRVAQLSRRHSRA